MQKIFVFIMMVCMVAASSAFAQGGYTTLLISEGVEQGGIVYGKTGVGTKVFAFDEELPISDEGQSLPPHQLNRLLVQIFAQVT